MDNHAKPGGARRRSRLRCRLMGLAATGAIAICSGGGGLARGADDDGPERRLRDRLGDAVPRASDPGAAAEYDPDAHRLPDLVEVRIGAWLPACPSETLFVGDFIGGSSEADFFRLDLVLRGLVNPPGDVRPGSFAPFAYGPHPLYGFVELDMDENVDTGGELAAPQYRYLGNIARFGGNVSDEHLLGRSALDATAFDDDITTTPLVDRSGEEFHLALSGNEFGRSDIQHVLGDADPIFESGELWLIAGAFFHRAHGYEDFSFVQGGQFAGAYMPGVLLQFAHDTTADETVVSVVFPLTQAGAGLQDNAEPEPLDFDPTNQVSVHEALSDLQLSAEFFRAFPSLDPNEAIVIAWADESPIESLEPADWNVTVLLGSSYTEPVPDGVYYVWSDVYPNVERGDVDGDEQADNGDAERIEQFIEANDAADGMMDGAFVIADFAEDFSVFDINHDGRVDGLDLLFEEADGDGDDDEDVDLGDFARFQRCMGLDVLGTLECAAADLDLSGETDGLDLPWFLARFEGPGHP